MAREKAIGVNLKSLIRPIRVRNEKIVVLSKFFIFYAKPTRAVLLCRWERHFLLLGGLAKQL